MEMPVYLFTGFLEGGKTHVIQESLEDQRFNSGEKTLLLVCEEGIDEYEPEGFWGKNVWIEQIEDKDALNEANLTALAAKHKYDRVVVEFNGMWSVQDFYEAMPEGWYIYQQMLFADASTFLSYNANMRQLMVDKLQNAEMVVLNRTPADIDKDEIHKVIRGITRRAAIAYDYPDGHVEYDEIEDPLPFDIEAPVIEIADRDYALWYRDISEEMNKYDGKTVRFKGIVARDGRLPKDTAVVGRHIMTCCEADIAYNGLVCIFPEAVKLRTRDWIIVTAKIAIEGHKLYHDKGPVLHAVSYEMSEKPEQEVATFY